MLSSDFVPICNFENYRHTLLNIIDRIKTLRNKRCHNIDFSATETFDEVQNIQKFFQHIKPGDSNVL